MEELKNLAKGYKKLVGEAIYPGMPYPSYKRSPNSKLKPNPPGQESRAYATGNLLSKFVSSPKNAVNNIAREIQSGVELVVDIAPKGAKYGQYVHYGTSKMLKRPFAAIANDDVRFQDLLDNFIKPKQDEIAKQATSMFKNLPNKIG